MKAKHPILIQYYFQVCISEFGYSFRTQRLYETEEEAESPKSEMPYEGCDEHEHKTISVFLPKI